jgi:hypothetical protein
MAIGFPSKRSLNTLNRLKKDKYWVYEAKTYSKTEAKEVAKKLHAKGMLAQAINLAGTPWEPDVGVRYVVMCRNKV